MVYHCDMRIDTNQEWHYEAQANQHHPVWHQWGMGFFIQGQDIMAGGYSQVGELVALPNQELRHHGRTVQEPDHQAGPHCQRRLSQPSVQERPDHSQVALYTDACYSLG